MDELISVKDLAMHFRGPRTGFMPWSPRKPLKALNGVSFALKRGQTLGLVGESGCGKSTLGRALLQLHRPTDGEVHFDGNDLVKLSDRELRPIRRQLQIIFQDPYASLDPRRSIGYTVGEPLLLSGMTDDGKRQKRVAELLELVGLNPLYENRYPHEFSGGQRQRVGIARALATDPVFIVADEPVSALDVSVQAQVINLLRRLQSELDLALLFISHDLRVVRYISDRVAVMYLGNIVEMADTDELFAAPKHPYTKALLSAIPRPKWEEGEDAIRLEGEVPSPLQVPAGCAFASRCPFVMDKCRTQTPPLLETGKSHQVACFLESDKT